MARVKGCFPDDRGSMATDDRRVERNEARISRTQERRLIGVQVAQEH